MKLFVYPHSTRIEVCTDPDANAPPLHCATVVLQHSDGSVGFDDHGLGVQTIKALARDVVVIERANSPEWFPLKMDAMSIRALHSHFTELTTCSGSAPDVMKELEIVSSNKKQAKMNNIRARHGKPQLPLSQTVFDDWIAPEGLVREHSARWMIDACQTFIVWSFSEWRLYASILGHSMEAVLEPVLRAAKELNIPLQQVQSESELPVW